MGRLRESRRKGARAAALLSPLAVLAFAGCNPGIDVRREDAFMPAGECRWVLRRGLSGDLALSGSCFGFAGPSSAVHTDLDLHDTRVTGDAEFVQFTLTAEATLRLGDPPARTCVGLLYTFLWAGSYGYRYVLGGTDCYEAVRGVASAGVIGFAYRHGFGETGLLRLEVLMGMVGGEANHFEERVLVECALGERTRLLAGYRGVSFSLQRREEKTGGLWDVSFLFRGPCLGLLVEF